MDCSTPGLPVSQFSPSVMSYSLISPSVVSYSLRPMDCSTPGFPVSQFSPSVVSYSLRPMDCGTPGFPVHHHSRSLFKPMSIKSVMPSKHLILCRPLLLPPSIFPSIRVFSNESVLRIRWPNYWSFSFSISPSNEYSELISFRIDWFDLFSDQGTLKSIL